MRIGWIEQLYYGYPEFPLGKLQPFQYIQAQPVRADLMRLRCSAMLQKSNISDAAESSH